MLLRLVHIAIVCLLSLVLTGLSRLAAADERVSTRTEQQAGDDRGEDDPGATPWNAYCAARLPHAPCPALPLETALPTVARLSLRWSPEATGAACLGAPQEVFLPPRKA